LKRLKLKQRFTDGCSSEDVDNGDEQEMQRHVGTHIVVEDKVII